jgi:TolB-like protein
MGDSADAYFADGVTDAVRDRLAGVPGVEVIGSTSSAQFRHPSKAVSQIGHELNVRYLLIGKVRWAKAPGAPSRVQVRPELIDVQSGTERWGKPFDAALTDVFRVQADLAAHVAQALGIALGRAERQTLAEKPTAELAAYDAYLKGQEIYQSTSTIDLVTLRRAIAFYEQAVAADSSFALAWAQLARARAEAFWAGAPVPALGEAARQAAERALSLAPAHARGISPWEPTFYRVTQDNTRALAELGRGQQLAPDNADVLTALAYTEDVLGRWESALTHLRRARALGPRSVLVAERLGSALLALRHQPQARTLARLLTVPFQVTPAWLRIDPTFKALQDDPQFKRLQRAP